MPSPDTSYGTALRATLRATAAAYGYTLTTATTLALLTSTHGVPDTSDVALFAGGGLLAFAILEGLAALLSDVDTPMTQGSFPLAGALNVVAVGLALAAVAPLANRVSSDIAWLLAPLVSTALYMLGVAVQGFAVARVRERGRRRLGG